MLHALSYIRHYSLFVRVGGWLPADIIKRVYM